MKIYWSLKQVPELADLSPKRRRRAHDACMRKYFFEAPLTRWSRFAFVLFLVSIGLPLFIYEEGFSGRHSLVVLFGVVAGGIQAGWFLMEQLAIPIIRPFYHQFINRELSHQDA
jgi:hypothetical protein